MLKYLRGLILCQFLKNLEPERRSKDWRNTLLYKAENSDLNDFIDFTNSSKLYMLESKIFSIIIDYTKTSLSYQQKYDLVKSLEKEKLINKVNTSDCRVLIDIYIFYYIF